MLFGLPKFCPLTGHYLDWQEDPIGYDTQTGRPIYDASNRKFHHYVYCMSEKYISWKYSDRSICVYFYDTKGTELLVQNKTSHLWEKV